MAFALRSHNSALMMSTPSLHPSLFCKPGNLVQRCRIGNLAPKDEATSSLHWANNELVSSLPSHKDLVCVSPHKARKTAIQAAVETEDSVVEPVTKVKFAKACSFTGSSKELSLAGTGYREKSIAFINVKVYAVGIYVDQSITASLTGWKGSSGEEALRDPGFFKAVIEAPVDKCLKICLVRDVDGATFWGALDDAIAPRLKAMNAGLHGQEALATFGQVFQGRPLKKGASIYLTWEHPSRLQVAISGDSSAPPTLLASIDSEALTTALYDVYLGVQPVSPTAKASLASYLTTSI